MSLRRDNSRPYLVALTVLLLPCWVVAQDAASPGSESASTSFPLLAERIAQKRADLATELTAARRNLDSASVQDGNTPPEHITKRVELLETIDLLYGQQHAQAQRLEELQTSHVQM